MKEIVINKGKLKDDEITEVLDKARIVLRNDDGEFILSHFERVYFLPGGKVEVTETPVDAYYFTGFTSKDDIEYFNLTRTEKRDDLRAFFVSMEDAKELLKEYNKDNPKAAYLAVETIKVLDEYENLEIE